MNERRLLTGRLHIDLPADQAFRLFTPLGEREWAEHWAPHFPTATNDDTAPGTVFQTGATIWVVLDRLTGSHISYARLTPEVTAGTVAVALADNGTGADVTVTYDLTALTDAANDDLRTFAAGYPEFLASWQEAIAALP